MSIKTLEARLLDSPKWVWERLGRVFAHPRLGLWLALCAVLLSSTALFLGFFADDWIGRYVYSELPGAERLFRNYSGGYGIATGDPAENHWQMEEGWAPWWHYDRLRFALYRPIGVFFHRIDFELWPNNAFLMHAQNLLWLAALVVAMTWMYRGVLGALVGGVAAAMFAFDETHGFTVGHICNRHALIGALIGALSLGFHLRSRRGGPRRDALLGPLMYALGLFSSESTIAVVGYVVAYALLAEQGTWRRRALGVAPYLLITVVWRVLYTRAGYGAAGSGVYIDMGREPLNFLRAFLERGPILWLGQLLWPPADIYALLPTDAARLMLGWALLVLVASLWALMPLLRRDPVARFWLLGTVGSMVPAAATSPHNRLLIFTSFGALALFAQLFALYATELTRALSGLMRWGKRFGVWLIVYRLLMSPLGLPFATVHIALTAPLQNAAAAVGDEVAGRDVVFVTAPGYNVVRLVQLMKRIDQEPLPARVRTISNEPKPITLVRADARTLEVTYTDGLLSPPSDDLHRDRRIPLPAGTRVSLSGFDVEVLEATPTGLAKRVRYTFDKPLEDPTFLFLQWDGRRFAPFQPPAVGGRVEVPAAFGPVGLE